MYCLKCGKEIDDDAVKCPYCDCPTENAEESFSVGEVDTSTVSVKKFGISSIILGASGVAFAWIFMLVGFMAEVALVFVLGGFFGSIPGGVGLALGFIGKRKDKTSKVCLIGIILSAVALFLALICWIIGIAIA